MKTKRKVIIDTMYMKCFLVFFTVFSLSMMYPHSAEATREWSSGFELQSAIMETDVNTGSGGSISTSIYRSGAASRRFVHSGAAGASYDTVRVQNNDSELFARAYIYVATAPSTANSILEVNFDTGGASALTFGGIKLNTDRTLQLFINDGTVQVDIGSPSSALALNTWYRVELDVSDPSGTITATGRLDGTQFATGSNSSTVTAANLGQIKYGINVSSWSGQDATADIYFDDVAANSVSGTDQTSWPGQGRIVYMRPDGNAGDNNAPAGTCADVADTPTPDDAATFATLSTDGGGDILDCNVQSSSSAGIHSYDTITFVSVGIREAAASASAEGWALRLKSASGATVQAGSSLTHNDVTYRTNGDQAPQYVYSLKAPTDPTTGLAWTPTGTNSLDNMQIGILSNDGAPDIHVSTLWALVEYVDGTAPATVPNIPRFIFNFGRFFLGAGRLIIN